MIETKGVPVVLYAPMNEVEEQAEWKMGSEKRWYAHDATIQDPHKYVYSIYIYIYDCSHKYVCKNIYIYMYSPVCIVQYSMFFSAILANDWEP